MGDAGCVCVCGGGGGEFFLLFPFLHCIVYLTTEVNNNNVRTVYIEKKVALPTLASDPFGQHLNAYLINRINQY